MALAGGTGAAKLLRGLAPRVPPGALTIVVNTGDDASVWGLHVSPDLDTVCYALAGVLDEGKGWGLADESFHALDQIARFGEPTWFSLGDRDLATHLHRTRLLRAGRSLSEVTRGIASALGVRATVLPMSDQAVPTRVRTPEGWLDFQEYFVREKAQVEVLEVVHAGAETARPAPGVVSAITEADVVLVCPSNPVTSIGPILAIPGIRAALAETAALTLAVSPLVAGQPVSGPAGRLMAARGLPVSAEGVARSYHDWLAVLVIDEQDAGEAAAVEALGIRAVSARTLMRTREDESALARRTLEIAAGGGRTGGRARRA
ncbi:MAG: 2-phospho-L-lactate transferase [Candidatus Rokubacteria bacterium]|nr:2-phospho-L-lactate transferase [Candidatus Rokubacteria bacterium]